MDPSALGLDVDDWRDSSPWAHSCSVRACLCQCHFFLDPVEVVRRQILEDHGQVRGMTRAVSRVVPVASCRSHLFLEDHGHLLEDHDHLCSTTRAVGRFGHCWRIEAQKDGALDSACC